MAPADTIARWWRDQAAVQMTSRPDAQGDRVTLDVARSGISGVKLVVIGPAAGKAPTIEGLQGAQVRKLDDQRWAVLLPELKAGKKELRVRF